MRRGWNGPDDRLGSDESLSVEELVQLIQVRFLRCSFALQSSRLMRCWAAACYACVSASAVQTPAPGVMPGSRPSLEERVAPCPISGPLNPTPSP